MRTEANRPGPSTVEELRQSEAALISYVRERAKAAGVRLVDVTVSRFPSEIDVTIWVRRDPGESGWSVATRISSDLQDAGLPVSVIVRGTREREDDE